MTGKSGRLLAVVEEATPKLLAIPNAASAQPPAPGKWSPREILGHLIDSAANNHQRFVRGQTGDDLVFHGYDQEAWVSLQKYRDADWSELVTLWRAYNRHLARIVAAIPEETVTRRMDRHNLDTIAWKAMSGKTPASLADLIEDYVDHMEHHLKQILGRPVSGSGDVG